jgi:hypothetical protein
MVSLAYAYSRENATDASNIPKLPTLLGGTSPNAFHRCRCGIEGDAISATSSVIRV